MKIFQKKKRATFTRSNISPQIFIPRNVTSLAVYALWRMLQVGLSIGAYVATQAYAVEIVGPKYKSLGKKRKLKKNQK